MSLEAHHPLAFVVVRHHCNSVLLAVTIAGNYLCDDFVGENFERGSTKHYWTYYTIIKKN
jgi:hypothetical protein